MFTLLSFHLVLIFLVSIACILSDKESIEINDFKDSSQSKELNSLNTDDTEVRFLSDFISSTSISKQYPEWSYNNISWKCNWTGVICQDNELAGLFLDENYDLVGTIPSSIALVSSISFLRISYTNIGALVPLPSFLGKMTQLTCITFMNNSYVGSIPKEYFSLKNLKILELGYNKLTSTIPSAIGLLSNIISIDLKNNKLSGSIPSAIGHLTKLDRLLLTSNSLKSSIPSSIGNLVNIKELVLGENSLTYRIPTSIYRRMRLLISLDFGTNLLTSTISTEIGFLKSIEYLRLDNNKFTSSIPSEIGFCLGLSSIRMSSNSLRGSIPSSIGMLSNLTYLHLASNMLSSSIPSALTLLPILNRLFLYSNMLTYTLPNTMGLLTSLSYMDFSGNNLSSTLPTSLCKLTNCQHFGFLSNRLEGSLLSCMGDLVSLVNLFIANNKFTSSIPASIGLCYNLNIIDGHSNKFSGIIPSSIGNLQNLAEMSFRNNRLVSSIPTAIGDAQKLKLIDLSFNSLTSSIPSTISHLVNLQRLFLSYNLFTDVVPTTICLISSLQSFGLRNNSIACSPACRTDIEWSGLNTYDVSGTYRCIDGQDHALYDMESSLSIASALDNVVHISSTIITRDREVSETFLISNPNAFEYSVTIVAGAKFCELSVLYFCVDIACKEIIGQYVGPYGTPPQPGVFVVLDNIPIVIVRKAFYVVVRSDPNMCPPQFYSYSLTVITRAHQLSNWKFGAPPYLSGNNTARNYALGLCTSEWTGLYCQNGFVTSIILKGYTITGTLPSTLSLLVQLTELDLSFNRISGTIVSSMALLKNLDHLIVSNNDLSGTIPEQFLALSSIYLASFAYNSLSGSVPTVLSQLTSIKYLLLDGNLFEGEVPSSLCEWVKGNRTLSLTKSSRLTCYQRQCWDTCPSKLMLFDKNLAMCTPTQVPTRVPTSKPTIKPIELVVDKALLDRPSEIGVSVAAAALCVALMAAIVYRFCFRTKTKQKRERSRRLYMLPVHKSLLEGNPSDKAQLRDLVRDHIESTKEKDYDGKTCLDIIFENKNRVMVDSDIVYDLLFVSLPVNVVTGETIHENALNDSWIKAIQLNDDAIVGAVKRILESCASIAIIRSLAGLQDSNGRVGKDIAGTKCKEVIMRKLYLNECYDVKEGSPEHKSHTSLVVFATLHTFEMNKTGPEKTASLALKFMRKREHFMREVGRRQQLQLSDKYVLPIISEFDGDSDLPDNQFFRSDAFMKGFEDYPYCIVMEAGNMSLKRIIDQQCIAGNAWEFIRLMTSQLAACLQHLHAKQLVHGDLKPLNVLQTQVVLKLIDLDASVRIGDVIGHKFSSCYLPPEMIAMDAAGDCFVKVPGTDAASNVEYELLSAASSFDMWSLGCVLYLMCTGATLFQGTVDDNISDESDLAELYEWSDTLKERKLKSVMHRTARDLLSLLLSKNPEMRPSASRVLSHPFLTGVSSTRLPGENAVWDVYISYRAESDEHNALLIYEELKANNLKVWMNSKCIEANQNLVVEGCRALISSAFVICVLSRDAVNHPRNDLHNLERLQKNYPFDPFLMEWCLALEMKERSLVNAIFPVLIGDVDASGMYNNYIRATCGPLASVAITLDAVEATFLESLEREGMGPPLRNDFTVKAMYDSIVSNQCCFIENDLKLSLEDVASEMVKMKNRLKYKSSKIVGERKMTTTQANIQATLLMKVIEENKLLKDDNTYLRELMLQMRGESPSGSFPELPEEPAQSELYYENYKY